MHYWVWKAGRAVSWRLQHVGGVGDSLRFEYTEARAAWCLTQPADHVLFYDQGLKQHSMVI